MAAVEEEVQETAVEEEAQETAVEESLLQLQRQRLLQWQVQKSLLQLLMYFVFLLRGCIGLQHL